MLFNQNILFKYQIIKFTSLFQENLVSFAIIINHEGKKNFKKYNRSSQLIYEC